MLVIIVCSFRISKLIVNPYSLFKHYHLFLMITTNNNTYLRMKELSNIAAIIKFNMLTKHLLEFTIVHRYIIHV